MRSGQELSTVSTYVGYVSSGLTAICDLGGVNGGLSTAAQDLVSYLEAVTNPTGGATGTTTAAEVAIVATLGTLIGLGALTGVDEVVGTLGLVYKYACATNTFLGPLNTALGLGLIAYDHYECAPVSKRTLTGPRTGLRARAIENVSKRQSTAG